MLQAGARHVEALAVVVRELMAALPDPVGEIETTAGLIHPGVNPVTATSAAVPQAGTGDSVGVPGMHQNLPVVSIAAMVIAAMVIAAMANGDMTSGVLRIAVTETVALMSAAPMSDVSMTGVSTIAAAVNPASRGIAPMTGVSRIVVPAVVASVTAMHEVFIPLGQSAEIARPMSSRAGKRVPMEPIPWLMIFSGAGMPLRRLSRRGARFIASGAPPR